MKNLKKISMIIALVLVIVLAAGCKGGDDDSFYDGPPGVQPPGGGGNDTPPGNGGPSDPDDVVFGPVFAKRAIPIPSSNTPLSNFEPRVLGAYSDGTSNFYIIDVGQVRDIFVSTIARAHFNGTTPISLTRTTVSTNTITSALTETISSSISKSDTWGVKSSVEASWKKKFPVAGTFSAKLSLEYNKSATTTNTSGRSTQTSSSEAQSFADSLSVAFTIGNNGEPAGWHRYAMYAVADVYYFITTCLNNEELKGWETVVATRTNSFREHMEFCPNGDFDNSPVDSEIIFPEDFWRNLPSPSGIAPPPPPDWFETNLLTIPISGNADITLSGTFNQQMDTINFKNHFDIDLNELRQNGFKTIDFNIQLDLRDVNTNGSGRRQWIRLFSSRVSSWDYHVGPMVVLNHGGGTNWRTYEFSFNNIPIDEFKNNEAFIRYSGDSSNSRYIWRRGTIRAQLLFRK